MGGEVSPSGSKTGELFRAIYRPRLQTARRIVDGRRRLLESLGRMFKQQSADNS